MRRILEHEDLPMVLESFKYYTVKDTTKHLGVTLGTLRLFMTREGISYRRFISEYREELYREMKASNKSPDEMADKLNMGVVHLHALFPDSRPPLLGHTCKIPDEDLPIIKELLTEMKSKVLCDKWGVGGPTLTRYLKKHGTSKGQIRREHIKSKYDELSAKDWSKTKICAELETGLRTLNRVIGSK